MGSTSCSLELPLVADGGLDSLDERRLRVGVAVPNEDDGRDPADGDDGLGFSSRRKARSSEKYVDAG